MNKSLGFLPLFTLCFASGICLVKYQYVPFLLLYGLVWLLLLFCFIFFNKHNSVWPLLILGVFLGGLFLKNSYILPADHISKFFYLRIAQPLILKGDIVSYPETRPGYTTFILNAQEIIAEDKVYRVKGKALVKIFRKEKICYGQKVLLRGKLYRPFSFSKGGFNYRYYLRHQGIYLIFSVKKGSIVKQLDKNVGNPLKSFAFQIRHKMRDIIVKNLSPFSAGILNAIILGERQNLPVYVRDVLVKSGTVHIIAISGLHLGIVAFIILLTLKIIKIPRRPRYILTIFLLIIYCILTGAKPPVVRATIMASILLFAYFLKREINIYNSLSLAALIILAVNPWQLFEVSFQLSFLSVVSIIWLSPKIKSLFPEKLYKIPWVRFLILTFSVSIAAWLGLLPLIAYYFRILSPITILANMIIVPYMAIIVTSGFSLTLIGILIPCLTSIFAASNELFILILFKINSLLIAIPGAYFKLSGISFIYILLYYSLLVSIFNFSKTPIITQIICKNMNTFSLKLKLLYNRFLC